MRSVAASRMTVPMKGSERQFRRRAVSGTFSSGRGFNRFAAVIITLWWRAIGIQLN